MPSPTDRSYGAVLVDLDVLLVQDPTAPRALDEAASGLDRLATIARPIVLTGSSAAGRRLTTNPSQREAWVRRILGRNQIEVVAITDETNAQHSGGNGHSGGDEWQSTRDALRADWLVTGRQSSVGPARRAGLQVVLIGPRAAGTVERADYEARDLLDAVNHLLLKATFSARAD